MKILSCIFAFCLALAGYSQSLLHQTVINGLANPTVVLTPTSTTAGSFLVGSWSYSTSGTNKFSQIVDSASNAYSVINNTSGASIGHGMFYCINATGGVTSVTLTFLSSPTVAVTFQEWSGVGTTASLDKSANSGVVTGTNPSSTATATTTQSAEIVFSDVGAVSLTAPTVGAGYSNYLSEGDGVTTSSSIESKVVAATGAQTGVFVDASSIQYNCGVATFKVTAVLNQGAVPPSMQPMTGVGVWERVPVPARDPADRRRAA